MPEELFEDDYSFDDEHRERTARPEMPPLAFTESERERLSDEMESVLDRFFSGY